MSQRPWLRALAWLAFLGPVFFLSYNFANAAAASRGASVPVLMFDWERHIPFLEWTIFPYWSSDLLYALSLLVCRTRQELDLHGKRLLAIQVFSIACFLAFPLRCVMERPALSEGWSGELFHYLASFDQPFNQAPSLHVSLAVILWTRFRVRVDGAMRLLTAAYLVMVAVSSLTTYQHQFIDLPTGAWAGLLVIGALPEDRVRRPEVRLALFYVAGSLSCTVVAFAVRGFAWWLLWPGFALSMVACAYWTGDAGAWLGKPLVLLPYTIAAWINSRLWTRGQAPRDLLTDGVWIGRAPAGSEGANSIVSLAPELPIRADAKVAMLDLVMPTDEQLSAAVQAIIELGNRRPTLVCCALGYSRSAMASAAWLLAAGHAKDVEDALGQVRKARPQVVVRPEFEERLKGWWANAGPLGKRGKEAGVR